MKFISLAVMALLGTSQAINLEARIWKQTIKLLLMLLLNSQLRSEKANKELPKKQLQLESIQLSSHRLRLKPKHKLKLK